MVGTALMITKTNSIYKNTILENIKFNHFEFYDDNSTLFREYIVSNDKIKFRFYSHIIKKLKLFHRGPIHDICHALYYVDHEDYDRLLHNNFGLKWGTNFSYRNREEFIDEIFITSLTYKLQSFYIENKHISKDKLTEHILYVLEDEHFGGYNKHHKKLLIRGAINYWTKTKIERTVEKLNDFLESKGF